ncbi:hypothetical protein LQG66_22935 [Bradyrhizobium ontarionense]|uniref:KfrA N-terminal DNA-binding domain-containing protein n=1 Tax=Bradyrhizobium ontarionense TaxID=2898149 RepID=A0ABY3R4A7_9BRAD|nr:hypothetical protein [Bradyrhizobium sp. A19]UFZ02146.1 hypothetical protein LQG66_22935 [Bradyrhizobium sp. A19]
MRDIRDDLRERLAAIQTAFNAATEEHENQMIALQAGYRQKADALERERQAVLQLLKIEEARATSSGPSIARHPALPLSEFIITKLHTIGPMTKEQIRAEVDRAGYLEGEATGRTFHLTLMNISGAGGRISKLPDNRYIAQSRSDATLFSPSHPERHLMA